ncbi:uncharacterized protein LOC113515489 [Galleria mellonella]|uniref:Uncharacterized protein LOC113515489 n=1 Tax=Galleria mellonella TaxID=7137 RepID=A0A6J1WTE2_GALME|nr:uncharacterized protein LOC113515489 [Galleria mellonella]
MNQSRSSSPFNWSLDLTRKLIEILHNHRRLWDRKHIDFRQIGTKRGLEIMVELLDTPNVTTKQLKCKLRNLQNTYNIEQRKILVAQKNGFFYRPSLPWFKEYNNVMQEVKEIQESPDESDSGEDIQHYHQDNSEENTTNSDTYIVSIKQECLDNIARGENSSIDFDEQPILRNPKRVHTETDIQDQTEVRHDDNFIMESIPMDEFQMFAEHIAEQLRMVTAQRAHRLQKEIELLFDNLPLVQIFDE